MNTLPDLVMLHGAMDRGEQQRPLANALAPHANVRTMNLIGHGGRPLPAEFTTEDFAQDVVAFLDKEKIERSFIYGYSSGAYVALYVARHFPERIRGVCTLAAKYVYDEETIKHFVYLLSPGRIRTKAVITLDILVARHTPVDWVAIANMKADYFQKLGEKPALTDDDLRAISVPALIVSADADQLVPREETAALGRLIPNSRVVMFRGQCHPFDIVPIEALANLIKNWMANIP